MPARYPRRPVRVIEHTGELAGAPIHWREAPAPATPPLYLHGAPLGSADLEPLLARTGGIAPDLLGFGRSAKGGHLDYSLEGQAEFVEALLEQLGVDRVRLFVHGTAAGGGLLAAQRRPERVERLVLCDAMPLAPGFLWAPPASWLRRPLAGELLMGSTSRRLLARVLQHAAAAPGAFPREALARIWEDFDQGTQRAILRTLRDASPERLRSAGASLARLTMPALILWGERDPWFPAAFAESYAQALPDARVELVAGAGHFPWLGRPEVVELIASFLG
jgi:pimeloyl-ACP methyl ester carboxylesterase